MPFTDADVRLQIPAWDELRPHLERHWADYVTESGLPRLLSTMRPAESSLIMRELPDSTTAILAALRTEVLTASARRAVIGVSNALDEIHNDDAAAAFAAAINRWQAEQVLNGDDRLRGSVLVGLRNPDLAVAEIERWSGDSRFVQVQLHVRSTEPLGRRRWWPIYRAAEVAGLAVAILPDGVTGNPTTAVGWPSTYLEDYVGLAQTYASQVLSLVSEGVFSEFPALRVVLVEAGFSWLPPLLWRFDKNWKGLRREIPWVREPPSTVIREHLRWTLQPVDLPADDLGTVLDQIGDDRVLLFSSAWPLRLTDDPFGSLAQTSGERLTRILDQNAEEVYRS